MEKKHVHETNPKRTFVTVIIFIVIIVTGLLTISNPRLKYALSPQQTVDLVAWEEAVLFPYELEDIFNGTIDTILLIDIRNRFEFGKGHIPGSENISAVTLLERDNIRRLKKLQKEGMTLVIYGDDQLQANGPWMVFQQLGFDNVRILLGGYSYYKLWKDNLADTYMDDGYMKGFPKVDYAEVAASNSNVQSNDEQDARKPVSVRRKKKTAVAEGGC